jgi:hypothetical protein
MRVSPDTPVQQKPPFIVIPPFRADIAFVPKHEELNGAPGPALRPGAQPETSGAGTRIRYQNGSLYRRPSGRVYWVHGAIEERYDQLGAGGSWLGLPKSDEVEFTEGGRATRFDNGAIYWWPDTGAIDLNQVAVRYSGFYAFGETDNDGKYFDDQIYAILGVVSPSFTLPSVKGTTWGNTDGGDSRPESFELYRGEPEGIDISVLLMEQDYGDPDKYKAIVADAVEAGSNTLATSAAVIPYAGPFIAVAVKWALEEAKEVIVNFINKLLDTDDDVLGKVVVHLSAKEMILLAARTAPSNHWGIIWKTETPLLSAQGGSWKVYFTLDAV